MEQCFKQKSSFRTIRIILFSLSMLFAYATNGYAQNMVRGVVTDVTGDPLPGVSVLIHRYEQTRDKSERTQYDQHHLKRRCR